MNHRKFHNILQTKHSYRTAKKLQLLVNRLPGWETLKFYFLTFRIVLTSSIRARSGRFSDSVWAQASANTINAVESSGGKVIITGLKPLSEHKGPVVYISNHMSMLDTFLLPSIALAFNKVTFVVKEELLHYPVFGPVMRAVKPIAVARKNPREDFKVVMQKGQELLNQGISIIIFPQSTRNPVFDPALFNTMGVKLAKKASVPVVPIALKTDFQGTGKLIKDFGPINPDKKIFVNFGAPITVEGNGQQTHKRIVSFIIENLTKWGGQIAASSKL
ncbi:MAG: 1-acyl-sn-glycerol-3-phosphate acyltransferase [Desulfobacterales bacterium]|nr:1-acyl-sn-glycerol-3-phosphate acyltransferase [Desulfobacterales bacterium]